MKTKNFIILSLILAGKLVHADAPSVHGMLLFGGQVNYASHLPMFHKPHDYQLILKLSFEELPGGKTLAAYAAAKAATGDQAGLYTLVPEVMDLTKVIDGTKTSFTAAIFKGHFERGGEELGSVKVKVEKIVFAQKLNGAQAPAAQESYVAFGAGSEYFAAHVIKSKPSFDEVMKIKKPLAEESLPLLLPQAPDAEQVIYLEEDELAH